MVRISLLVRMVDCKVLGHAIVEVLTLDGFLVLVEPVDGVPPGLAFVGRHDVFGLADLAGDVILGPGAGVISSVETTLAGATRREDAARQVELHKLVLDLILFPFNLCLLLTRADIVST